MTNVVKGVLEQTNFNIKWKIEGFYADCHKVGDSYESSEFPIRYKNQTTNWKLKVYPKGNEKEEENVNYVGIYLYFQSESVSEVLVNYQLSIVNRQNDLFRLGNKRKFQGPTSNRGWNQFAEPAVLKNSKNGALIDDTVTITCEITFCQDSGDGLDDFESLLGIGNGLEDYAKLLESNSFSDVTFDIKGEKMYLHKAILTCRSAVFKAMFGTDMKEKIQGTVDINDVDFEVMKELFRFIYTGKVENIEIVAKDLLIAADKYDVIKLKALCEKTLYDSLTIENAIEYLKLTEMCDTILLNKLVIKFIANNLKGILATSESKLVFAELDPKFVFEIMQAVANKYILTETG